jgi:hypothetical protein
MAALRAIEMVAIAELGVAAAAAVDRHVALEQDATFFDVSRRGLDRRLSG